MHHDRTPPRPRGGDRRCRVWLGGWLCGEGDTMQAAADDLVDRAITLASGLGASPLAPTPTANTGEPSRSVIRLLWRLGRRVSRAEGEQELVFGTTAAHFSL
jgi:hypothetical protein